MPTTAHRGVIVTIAVTEPPAPPAGHVAAGFVLRDRGQCSAMQEIATLEAAIRRWIELGSQWWSIHAVSRLSDWQEDDDRKEYVSCRWYADRNEWGQWR